MPIWAGSLCYGRFMLREEQQAAAVRLLKAHGDRLKAAKLVVADETRRVKTVVQQALAAGVPTRRIRELTGVSLDSINRWGHDQQPT